MSEFNQPLYIDVICCIDSTFSMSGDQIRNGIKTIMGCQPSEHALFWNLPPESTVRYKILNFRDFLNSGGKEPLEQNSFVTDPADLGKQIDLIDYVGGGDKPENALEAIYTAMRIFTLTGGGKNGDQRRSPMRLRQVVVLFSDSVPFKPDGTRSRLRRLNGNYPQKMPKTLKGLKTLWNKGDPDLLDGYQAGCGRLVICAPFTDMSGRGSAVNWYQVTEGMDRTWFVPMDYSREAPLYDTGDLAQAREMILSVHPGQKYEEE